MELHGGATEPTCRVIEDLLSVNIFCIVERFSSHRPADVDGPATRSRAESRRPPRRAVSGWPSDLSKAYKRMPGDLAQLRFVAVAQWCHYHCRPVLWIVSSQLCGGSSSPLNSARYTAWMCEALAVLITVAASHRVDDMIGVDPPDAVMRRWEAWRFFASRGGWEVSDEMSPQPSQTLMATGVVLDTSDTPKDLPSCCSLTRNFALSLAMRSIHQAYRLSPWEVSSLAGRLGFALCAVIGR